jgi:hypothetical protein
MSRPAAGPLTPRKLDDHARFVQAALAGTGFELPTARELCTVRELLAREAGFTADGSPI